MDTSAASLSREAADLFRHASFLLRWIQRGRPYNCPLDLLLQLVPGNCSVLDIGCGAGLTLGVLARQGRLTRGVGVETNPNLVSAARRMARSLRNPGLLEFRHCSTPAQWPSERFPVVMFVDVLHHVPPERQQAVFLEVAARVAQGGILIYKDMNTSPAWMAVANRLHDWVIARERIHYLPVGAVESYAAAAGLVMEHAWAGTRLWYSHELRVFRYVSSNVTAHLSPRPTR